MYLDLCGVAFINYHGGLIMKSTGSSVAKGIGVGMLVGGAMTLIGSTMMNSKKANYKKMAKKAIKSAESFMDSMM